MVIGSYIIGSGMNFNSMFSFDQILPFIYPIMPLLFFYILAGIIVKTILTITDQSTIKTRQIILNFAILITSFFTALLTFVVTFMIFSIHFEL